MNVDARRYVYAADAEVDDIDLDAVVVHDAKGRRVTEATLDKEADELAQRYPGLQPGGKSLSHDGTHSPTLHTVVSKQDAQAIHERAAAAHMSVSKYLRQLIERELARS